MKLQKTRNKHDLGQTGIVGAQGDEKSDGREIFLKGVEQYAPKVLENLSKEVFDRWNELRPDKDAPIPKHLRDSIRDWAIRWNLTWAGQPAAWIVEQVESTFSDWMNNPKLVGCKWGTFPGSHEHRPVVYLFDISDALMVVHRHIENGSPLDRIEQRARRLVSKRAREAEQFTIEMAVDEVLEKDPDLYTEYLKAPSQHPIGVACMPTRYPLQHIRDALQQLQNGVQDVLKHSNSDLQFRKYLQTKSPSPHLEKRQSIDADRFVWAVRFQCLRHTYAQITASKDIDWIECFDHIDNKKLAATESALPAIAAGIRAILYLVELTPRGGDKGGLPKSSK